MAADDQLAEWEAEWQAMAPEMRLWAQRLWGESPRGVILIVGAYGDEAVERLLRAACLDVKQVDELLDSGGSAPLGSFGAKIKACWCLGFLPEDEYVNLEQIRKMRNEAAHNLDTVSFESQKIKQHLANLRVASFPHDDDPIARLSYVVGAVGSWVRLAEPILRTKMTYRTLNFARTESLDGTDERLEARIAEHAKRDAASKASNKG
jgi:hypothetical protein